MKNKGFISITLLYSICTLIIFMLVSIINILATYNLNKSYVIKKINDVVNDNETEANIVSYTECGE